MSKLETNTIDTVSGTNTLQVGDGNVATINLGKSGDTINVPSGATITMWTAMVLVELTLQLLVQDQIQSNITWN